MSTFFYLKITSFLCLQIFPTIANYISFHTMFCLVFKLLIWKCWKCILRLWCTELTPIQLSHIFHTFCDIIQEKNRCDALSSQSRHNSHKECCNWTPFTDNLSFVGNLSKSSFHPNNCAFRITLIFHNSVNTLSLSPSKLPIIFIYMQTLQHMLLLQFPSNSKYPDCLS